MKKDSQIIEVYLRIIGGCFRLCGGIGVLGIGHFTLFDQELAKEGQWVSGPLLAEFAEALEEHGSHRLVDVLAGRGEKDDKAGDIELQFMAKPTVLRDYAYQLCP